MNSAPALPHCDMREECSNKVTHIGEKGYVYCAECVPCRQGIERCRRMRPFELRILESGSPLPFYSPRSKAETLAAVKGAQ